ncbi:MAG: glycosyltransferase family 2 protein [Nitriliruptorales bacterium]
MGRVHTDGKQFATGDGRFRFHGVTYGTFRPRQDGARFPEADQVKRDFYAMRGAGFSVVRTYTTPPEDVIEAAANAGLRLLSDVFYPDWRYLLGRSRRSSRRIARQARAEVRAAAHRLAGCETMLALSLGNEIPADVLRWFGTKWIADVLDELSDEVREVDPAMLVTYANYPTAEYLPLPSLDFLTFNVFLEQQPDFRRYLTRLHNLAGDRPLVLGETGLDAGGDPGSEQRQAETLDWILETALERGVAGTCLFSWTDEWWVGNAPVEGWRFGLTRADRSPRPALQVAERWNQRTVADLAAKWPKVSAVVCAYNAAATLDECLRHTCALDYPDLEIIVVDDGSTDDTAAIARRHPRVKLVEIEHAGLSVARNEGFRAATGELVAYLDSDAYPSLEWPYYLALGLDSPTVGGVGGPNVPPVEDPIGAHVVARSPGGPVHVLLSDDRAEHIPGCNMAFWKELLEEVGGFDPVYTAAGDDVDLCWKVLDRGWDIAFHPAALVWHHRRPGLRAYLRQQAGYGRAEALVEARHPDRFTTLGSARWRGRIYNSLLPGSRRQRVYRGLYGTAAYQSVYHAGGHLIDLAHQAGVPVAAALLLAAPFGLIAGPLELPALVGLLGLVLLGAIDVAHARPPRDLIAGRWRFRLAVALHHLLQPLVRASGRRRHGLLARRELPPPEPLSGPVRQVAWSVWLVPHDRPRGQVAAALVTRLRRLGLHVGLATGWEDYDARWVASTLFYGELVTSAHPIGCVQVRIRRRLRRTACSLVLLGSLASAAIHPLLVAALTLAVMIEVGRGWWRSGRSLGETLFQAISPNNPPPVDRSPPPSPARPRATVPRAAGRHGRPIRPQHAKPRVPEATKHGAAGPT